MSIFSRLLLAMLSVAIVAQALNFLVVSAIPAPEQMVSKLTDIEAALTGDVRGDAMAVSIRDAPPLDNFEDPRERRLRLLLARSLKIAEDDVRIVLLRARPGNGPPTPAIGTQGGLLPRFEGQARPDAFPQIGEDGLVIGSFEAAARLPDGRWRQVESEDNSTARWTLEAVAWLLAVLAIAGAFAWFMARRISRPIAELARSADRVGKGDSKERVVATGAPELRAAAQAINAMQDRLQRFVEDRVLMTGAIAHDLRTPLQRLALRVASLPEDERSGYERDITEMKAMIEETLAFVGDLAATPVRRKVSLRSLLQTIADDFSDRGESVEFACAQDVVVHADTVALRRLFNNLVENAVRYGDRAKLTLAEDNDCAVVEVSDSGPGIPPGRFEDVFRPFYRLESSRNAGTGGTGLGLSSARSAARSHGGDIELANRDDGGLIATVSLPL